MIFLSLSMAFLCLLFTREYCPGPHIGAILSYTTHFTSTHSTPCDSFWPPRSPKMGLKVHFTEKTLLHTRRNALFSQMGNFDFLPECPGDKSALSHGVVEDLGQNLVEKNRLGHTLAHIHTKWAVKQSFSPKTRFRRRVFARVEKTMPENNKWDLFIGLFIDKKDIFKREILVYQSELITVQQLYQVPVVRWVVHVHMSSGKIFPNFLMFLSHKILQHIIHNSPNDFFLADNYFLDGSNHWQSVTNAMRIRARCSGSAGMSCTRANHPSTRRQLNSILKPSTMHPATVSN